MPTLSRPLRKVDPGQEVVVFASRLALQRRRDVPGFLADTLQIRKQLDRLIADPEEGLRWYALRTDLAANVFWTTSVWRDDEALRAFVIAEPHAAIMRKRRRTLGGFETVRWTASGFEVPVTHAQTVERLTSLA
ncbi:MAG: DUF3291 domain-containing protein [Ilumatobacteraceae bacterium]